MSESTTYRLVYCTVPSPEVGETLAGTLVEQQLAACVNILPGLTSVYRWQGKTEKEPESLLLIKTREDRLPALQEAILAAHPYELPEIIAVPISSGLPAYLDWIDQGLTEQS